MTQESPFPKSEKGGFLCYNTLTLMALWAAF